MVKIKTPLEIKQHYDDRVEVVFDIETTGLLPWSYNERITCICAKINKYSNYELPKHITKNLIEFKKASISEVEIILEFVKWLNNISDGIYKRIKFISGNGRSFDIPYILSRIAVLSVFHNEVRSKQTNLFPLFMLLNTEDNHFDVVVDITDKPISINNLARIYGLPLKTGDGVGAISLFEKRKLKELEEYCFNDVLLTEQICAQYRKLQSKID